MAFRFGDPCLQVVDQAIAIFAADEEARPLLFRPLLLHYRTVIARDPSTSSLDTKRLISMLEDALGGLPNDCIEAAFLKKELQVGKVEDQVQPFWRGNVARAHDRPPLEDDEDAF